MNETAKLKPGRYDVYVKPAADVTPERRARFSRDTRIRVTHAKGSCGYGFDMTRDVRRQFLGTYDLDASSRFDVTPGNTSGGETPEIAFEFEPCRPREFKRNVRDTLTPVTMNVGDTLLFRNQMGYVRRIELVSVHGEIAKKDGDWVKSYRFGATFRMDGREFSIERETPSASNFAMPFEFGDLVFYLDLVQDLFVDCGGFLGEKDYEAVGVTCRPKRRVRLVVQEAGLPICPENIVEWFPGASRQHLPSVCFHGYNTWAGPWLDKKKTLAHGGLDINMPDGTMLVAPISFDDQAYYQSIRGGDVNNRWRGERKWLDGTTWWLISNHINHLEVREHVPLEAGTVYAETAGTWVGLFEHSHFSFRVFDGDEDFWLDPWIVMRASLKA